MTDLRPERSAARRLCGLLCLLALLLYTPAVQGAWLLLSGACCGGDSCPIAGHRHGAHRAEAPADCGHSMEPSAHKMSGCSMSCCRTAEELAPQAHVFVPAPALAFASPAPSLPAAPAVRPLADSLSQDPAIPPPKSL